MTHNDDFFDDYDDEDDDGMFVLYPDRGVMNPLWVLKAATLTVSPARLTNGILGLCAYIETLDEGEGMVAGEVVDVIVQNMFTGTYTDPYAHVHPSGGVKPSTPDNVTDETPPLNETDLAEFMRVLGTDEGEEPHIDNPEE